ncbi:Protein CBG05229 [Caenorhabditis briggsae]|uniref:Protein CBG05229 n=1 Tax=Caenorhabditis briggsae TaxID=6238 RepID=A8WZF6_CAEBR|nr:Protein CBG05229 [Caenorhabditis briggsae]CAP25766.2 Protein CBG05229 [Caenorhabditis briggsae]
MTSKLKAVYYIPWRALIVTGCFATYFIILGFTMLVPVLTPQHYFVAHRPVFGGSSRQITKNITKTNYWDKCELPVYDFYDEEILPYVEPNENPIPYCNPDYKPLTTPINGSWDLKYSRLKLKCRTRCHWHKSERVNKIGNWSYKPGPVDCEVLEAVCAKNGTDVYGYLHTQVIPTQQKKPEVVTKKWKQYDVTVILIDSLAYSQARRSLPRTITYMSNHMDAVIFPYINKVGDNSRPNGAALWFGKLLEKLDRSLFDEENVAPDWTQEYMCNVYKDNETSLFHEFQNYGYKTLLAEDWAEGTLNWPNCKGFDKPPIDHYMRPFQNAMERKNHGVEVTKNHLNGDMCREYHHTLLDYLGQFLDAYPDQRKFSWVWLSVLGHDTENSIAHSDNDFYSFLVKHRKQLDNSFVFFMGDHGLRFGNVRKTFVGALDVNNPFLSISIPKELRKNSRMLSVMRENARKLQTHFDTRSALLDILKFQSTSDFADTAPLEISGEKGYSYLREQPNIIRNCKNTPIPIQYCICQFNKTAVSTKSRLALSIGDQIAYSVNEELQEGKLTKHCIEMKVDRIFSLLKFDQSLNGSSLYTAVVQMKLPSQAIFKANVKILPTGKVRVLGMIERTNSYWNTANCISSEHHRPYCYCKNQNETYW